jgi:hypothetical protein
VNRFAIWYSFLGAFNVLNAAYFAAGPWSRGVAALIVFLCLSRLALEWPRKITAPDKSAPRRL